MPLVSSSVLVVEDDRDQLQLRTAILVRSGYQVLQALDGASARQTAFEHRPRCVIVDLRLPTEEEGVALIRDLKAVDPTLHIFVLTGANPARFRQRPEAQLVDAVFLKPVSSLELLQRLRAIDFAR